ncbi:MAG: polyphosphate kinase 1 [Proteobacteria bacterium]|nr:polyphosphate kinase 1 [Pseudomonadota bacterium]
MIVGTTGYELDAVTVAEPADPPPLNDPSLYLNREIGVVDFNRRVLELAKDPDLPLLERLRFLTICSSNLDEFFEVRVAGLKQLVAAGSDKAGSDGLTPTQALARISEGVHSLVSEQYRVLNEILLPALAAEGVHLHRRDLWTDEHRDWIADYFRDQVLPVLTPVALDPAHPFPRILNKALHFAVWLEGSDAFGRPAGLAIVPVPRCLPRVIELPGGEHDHVLLSSVIHAHVDQLFAGMTVRGVHQFRVTRNSDLWVDEEEVEDLLDALRGELPSRKFSDAVRLEVAAHCPDGTARLLLRRVGLTEEELYRVDGPVNVHRLKSLIDEADRPDLLYPAFTPGNPARRPQGVSIFERLQQGDVLVHHPFQSFSPVMDLLREAARDPNVLAIKQTLYRTGADSPVVQRLIEAAQAGKEVTAIVELRARFDEAANIKLAEQLQEAGASVVYGVVGYKCHAKLLSVVRREGGKLRRYSHIGTGNYHSATVRAYTDFGYMTCDKTVGRDVHKVFMQLTSVGRAPELDQLLQSPFTLPTAVLELIAEETSRARRGKPSRIQARMNALTEPTVIQALYEASQAGVPIQLIVRGTCCLRPGVPGVSETIEVRSVVGRFLEHSRVWRFGTGRRQKVFITSADWMPRNLHRRVEVAFAIPNKVLRKRVVNEGLDLYFKDDARAWLLRNDGGWVRARPGDRPVCAQSRLLARLAGG